MSDGFIFEDCLLKHHVRTDGWLPLCQSRKTTINAGVKEKHHRRIKYFTFCAVGAVDVLMLDVARVISLSPQDTFDTVFFFDKDQLKVVETQKRIPGAIGFVGNFVQTVLGDDLGDPHLGSESDQEISVAQEELENEPLSAERLEKDTAATRERQRRKDERNKFIRSFPFDIINLDLEEFLLKPNDPFPGKVINALRSVFRWQHRPLTPAKGSAKPIDGFSLMFTTQVGPPDLTAEYLGMLRDSLTTNIQGDASLAPILVQRAGSDDVAVLQNSKFDLFFKLAMPKVLANVLMEEDWYVDPTVGIKIYEFERASKDGPYKMLHLVTDIKRQVPAKEQRAPGTGSPVAQLAYREVVKQVFQQPEVIVDEKTIDKVALQKSLDKIKARRKKYYPDE